MRLVRVLGAAALLSVSATAQKPPEAPESVLFEEIPKVETAVLYTQTLTEAPANVTVITHNEIRRYGYRTLAEALSNVRGFYVTSDGGWQYLGVRGFNLPGDYNTRILVLVNGHYLTDNVYSAMYMFGQDFGIDMDLIERIEIVRGPSSALYGSNGLFATINIFTRSPSDARSGYASTESATFGGNKLHLSAATYLGRGANLLVSWSGFLSPGRTLTYPGLGVAPKLGAEHGYHGFIHLAWRDWTLVANLSDRKTILSNGWFGAEFGNTGTASRDNHDYVDASWSRQIGKASSVRARMYYDRYRYFGTYDYAAEYDVPREFDLAEGEWVGTQLSAHTPLARFGTLTAGVQLEADIRNLQSTYDFGYEDSPKVFVKAANRRYGVFVQQEWNMGPRWTVFLGARADDSRLGDSFISPRAALTYRPSPRSAYKLLYGRAFRDPSTFERFWEPNPALASERMHTLEFVRESNLGRKLDAVVSVFHYRLTGLIEGVPVSDLTLQYQNARNSHATGFELEVRGRPSERLEFTAGYTYQRASYRQGLALPNSPDQILLTRASTPLVRNLLTAAIAARYLSSRRSVDGSVLGPVPLADLTLTTERLHPNLDVQFGLRNLLDRRYADPMSDEHLTTMFPRARRSLFLKVIWHSGD